MPARKLQLKDLILIFILIANSPVFSQIEPVYQVSPGSKPAKNRSSRYLTETLQVFGLTTEYLHNPIGIDSPRPRLSWKLRSPNRGTVQQSYEIRVGERLNDLIKDKNAVWRSGMTVSDQSVLADYQGPDLEAGKRYYWQVRITDNLNKTSAWGEAAYWQMGLLNKSNWTARWIGTFTGDTIPGPSPCFRKEFSTTKTLKSATAYITAHGIYEAWLNGQRVGKDLFTPGWTSYHKRLLYQSYDVTALIRNGTNTAGFMLGDGWYRGNMGFEGKHGYYGNQLSGLMQLILDYTDGTRQVIGTDQSWKYRKGPVRYSDIYNGETYDARLELGRWSQNDYPDGGFKPAIVLPAGPEKLEASISPLAAKHEEFKPLRILKTPKGETVIDFGQNLVGWVRFVVQGPAGTQIKINHGEVLDKAGNFYDANLRKARQQISYTLKGGGPESYEPHFTYQGFRYVRITGYPGTIRPENFTAVAVYANLTPTGEFSCSNTLLNQLQHNIQWGQKGNFVDVPTDCPQRDERLGWTGDAQVFSRTAAYNMQVSGFFTKWLQDVAADQLQDGAVPFVIPNVLGDKSVASTGWADVATIIPWNMYLAYGDRQLLKNQYPSMKAWVGYMTTQSRHHLWNTGFHFGDWLFYHPDDDNDGRAAITDKYLIAQCFYAHSTQLLISTARVLGNDSDARAYSALLSNIKNAFTREYLTPNGRLVSSSQTAYVLALNFDMLPDSLRRQAAARLVANVKDYGNHLTTGFLGTPYLCQVLSRFGYDDIAYTLLLQDTYPSWLYPVKMGATTIWERWDGIKPNGSFQTTDMNSFNHYAYGAIGDWMYRNIAGIDTKESGAGYKAITIAPHPGGKLSYASAKLETMYGMVSSSWKIEGTRFILDVEIPPNTSADITLPGAAKTDIAESGSPLTQAAGVSSGKVSGKDLHVAVGSGIYHFSYQRL